MIFFKPTKKFIIWLKEYKGNRKYVVDIGCGEGLLLHKMNEAGIFACGLEPYDTPIPDPSKNFPTPYNIVPQKAENSELIRTPNMLLLIARPCHSGFAYRTIKNRNIKNEVLYIGKENNIECDLNDIQYTKINITEVGDEEELVLSIKGVE